MRTSFVSGPGKLWADLGLFFRLFFGAVGRFGFRGAFRELRGYLRDNRNLFDGAAKRYVRRGPHVYAASALPPINSRAFVDYLLEEIHTFNHKQLSPMIMGLISATSRCPYRCKYCYAIDELRTEEVVPVEAVARAVDSLGQMKVPTVFLTGGEVMMRKDDLPAILAPAVAHGMSAYLVSSGWGMDRQTLEGLLPYNLVGVVISLDSRHEERVATSKGQRDAFSRAMGAIAAARDLGLLVSVDCMGTTEVLEDFDSFGGFDDFDLAALRGSARRSEGAGEFVRKNPYMIGL